ncbi:TRAP transporter substrate-binding protein [Aurantimonas sp. 22II-16-19i]|uniref:TRAP transporter substrate-binding protein n=1 Tax=Aurantimonas sp. 22II-16-19i TaxID=1317114 RepID=UPI0009F7C3D6|nr:TRAP transporter substrate-binding protein [Aurantimonas sp. 22II-16-19i]ORE97288.1 TRAP dicarboxylate transporter subunit DctP [Aurantimonas sp. 22II-16-19i]
MQRRQFLAGTAIAASALAAPAVARAQTSFSWKMTNAYGPGSPFYVEGPGSPTDFCKKVEAMSGGRLKIQHFAAGELIPALEGFDAVQNGIVEMNAANAYFWAGKIAAAQYFTTVPFGMDVKGTNAWLYEGGGIDLWHELYEPLGMLAFPMGNTGVQMTGWFRKEINTVEDFDGLKMRIPGLAGKVYAKLGVNVQLLPGGEIFPALERGVIDAAEFVGPYQDRRLGLQKAAKYYYTTGWHEPNNVTELLINKAAWDTLPADLQAIVQTAAMACNVESNAWCDATNAEAMDDLVKNFGVIAKPLPDAVVEKLREVTTATLAEGAEADPRTKKVHEAYFAFKKQYGDWAGVSAQPLLPVLYKS